MFPNISLTSLLSGTVLSTLVHLGAGGGVYYWFFRHEPAPIVADLDLSMMPLVAMEPNAGGGYGKPSETWFHAKKGTTTPLPVREIKPETKEDVIQDENKPSACPEPCTTTGTGTGWGGGTGAGEGQYIPVSETSRKPRWVRNFITSKDYPAVAREQGKDGRVTLSVLIDSEGHVRDARLMEGSYEVLNEVALRKVREAVFLPAYDKNGRPCSCKVTLPIRFELR